VDLANEVFLVVWASNIIQIRRIIRVNINKTTKQPWRLFVSAKSIQIEIFNMQNHQSGQATVAIVAVE
jgi:3-methyladenine DNA glycosylase Mpg